MGPTPSCLPSFQECGATNGNVSIQLLRSPPPLATHHRRYLFHPSSSAEFIRFWAKTISFLFWSEIALLYGTVELLTETPG